MHDIVISKGHADCISAFLDFVQDKDEKKRLCNLPNQQGTTPLLAAIAGNYHEIVVTLLKAGADPNLANGAQITPLSSACASSAVTHGSGVSDRSDDVQLLLDHGADPTRTDANGATPLMVASFSCNHGAVRTLLKCINPSDIDRVDGSETAQTALWLAASAGAVQCCRLLVDAGSDVKHVNAAGMSVADAARGERAAGCEEIMAIVQCQESVKIEPSS
mmetsp:Transcript_16270/g.32365  ORF Transcript_16270/g.32365 Transcript_16270/m.32365 type:complete len:219 (-) Transcript_16270:45-701(-)